MTRALVVIDVQNEYDHGALHIVHPPLATSLPNIAAAMDAAAGAGIPVVVVVQRGLENGPAFAPGTHGAQLHPVVAARPADHTVTKTLPGAFTETGLEAYLRERDIDTVTLVGFMTQNCVDATGKQAFDRGFAVEILSDATGTLPYANEAGAVSAEDLHRAVLVAQQARFAAVTDTAQWIEVIRTGTDLPRSSVVASARLGRDTLAAV